MYILIEFESISIQMIILMFIFRVCTFVHIFLVVQYILEHLRRYVHVSMYFRPYFFSSVVYTRASQKVCTCEYNFETSQTWQLPASRNSRDLLTAYRYIFELLYIWVRPHTQVQLDYIQTRGDITDPPRSGRDPLACVRVVTRTCKRNSSYIYIYIS